MSTVHQAFIIDAVRTPIGKYAGALADVRADDLAAVPLRFLIERNLMVPPEEISDVILGCANQAGEDNRNIARMSLLLAGLPETVPGKTVNRLCASGMSAVIDAAQAIISGAGDLFIAGGVESMSRAPFVLGKQDRPFGRSAEFYDTTLGWRFVNPLMKQMYGVDSMGETAENVAKEYHVSRLDQDRFALRSQEKAARAKKEHLFDGEITPVEVRRGKNIAKVTEDEFPRPDTTLEALGALKPAFHKEGSVTAGNSSGINDGACALLLASSEAVKKYSLRPRARFVGGAAAGVAPRLMGLGPVPATQKLLARTAMTLSDMDVIELNEAFAAQSLASLRLMELQDDDPRVNRLGGAIALGHPLGMSGARLITTALCQLEKTGGRYALCSMCVGVGQGVSCIIERVS